MDNSVKSHGSAERTRKYRAKMDKERAEQVREKDRLRKKDARVKKRNQLLNGPKKDLEAAREKKREEMRRYRAKQKAKVLQESRGTDNLHQAKTVAGKKKARTMKKRAVNRENYAKKKMEKTKKKQAVLRTKNWRLKVKIKNMDKVTEN